MKYEMYGNLNKIEVDCFFEQYFIDIESFCLLNKDDEEEQGYNYLYIRGNVCFLANINDFDIVWWKDFNVDMLIDFQFIRDDNGCY